MPVPNLGAKHATARRASGRSASPLPGGTGPGQGGAPSEPARMFAFAVPGLAGLLAGELEAIEGIRALETGFDGRSDIVTFTADKYSVRYLSGLALAEDIFVEAGRTLRSEGDRASWIAGRLLKPERTTRALQVRGQIRYAVRARASYRVIVRVLHERSFLRTDLRRHLTATIARQQPRWHSGDPSDLELWAVEYQPGKLIAGYRASDGRMRRHDGRAEERSGALRPTIAAAMVSLAGTPADALLDPCCGSGTILSEAIDAGWDTVCGADIDPCAVEIARRNARGARFCVGDARNIDLDDESMDACVSNLPFGKQYDVQGDMDTWLRAVLGELARVTRSGGRDVLLAPAIARNLVPGQLRLTDRIPIRLLGTKTTIWAYSRS
jgi:tRNA G10  N-methylase Trm11